MIDKHSPIGIIDSGIGGFSVVKQVQRLMPEENLLYLGDGANTPYGNHTREEIVDLAQYMLSFMKNGRVKVLMVACNTISCLFDLCKREMPCPVLSMVQAGADAVKELPVEKIGVISSVFTHNTRCYPEQIHAVAPGRQVFSQGCVKLAELIERHLEQDEAQDQIECELRRELDQLVYEVGIDCCVLGCTHYPLVENMIRRTYPRLLLLDPARKMAEDTKAYLEHCGLRNASAAMGTLEIYTTGSAVEYHRKARKVGLHPITAVKEYPALVLP